MSFTLTTLINNLLPMLHVGSTADLVWRGSSAAQLERWGADWIKRHAQQQGVFVMRDASTTLANATEVYDAPADHLDTMHVCVGTSRPLVASSTTEIEALDEGFSSTAETSANRCSRWYADRIAANKIGIYPVPATNLSAGSTLDVIYHGFPCDLTSGITAPVVIADWLELAMLAEAYSCESDGQMVETAAAARQVMGLVDEVINVYYGGAQV